MKDKSRFPASISYLIRKYALSFLTIAAFLFSLHSLFGQGTQSPLCCQCGEFGVQDTPAMYKNGCPPGMDDAILSMRIIPEGPTYFYSDIVDTTDGTFIGFVDTFLFATASFDFCITNSCYTVSWFLDTTATVELILDGTPPQIYIADPFFYHQENIGYGCCDDLSISVSATNATCPSYQNGSAAVVATGGKAPYSYEWTLRGDSTFRRSNAANISALAPGIYDIQVSDAAGCNVMDSVEIVLDAASNVVTNTLDAGEHSFRDVILCATDTIIFDPVLFGDTITLTTTTIEIDKSLVINADPAHNIYIDASTILMPFAFAEGNDITIQGLNIISGVDGLLENHANATFKDITTYTRSGSEDVIINSGTFTAEGSVLIQIQN